MREIKRNGFVLFIVIVTMVLVGAGIFLLSGDSNIILFQTNEAYLKACEQNLVASGLAWAKQKTGKGNADLCNKKISLNPTNLSVKNATLDIIVGAPVNKEVKVQIHTSCQRGRLILRHNGEYRIRL